MSGSFRHTITATTRTTRSRRENPASGSARCVYRAGPKRTSGHEETTLYRPARRRDERPCLIYGVSHSLSLRGKGFPCSSRDRSYLCRPFLGYRLNRRTLPLLLLLPPPLLLLLRLSPRHPDPVSVFQERRRAARTAPTEGNPGIGSTKNDANKNT